MFTIILFLISLALLPLSPQFVLNFKDPLWQTLINMIMHQVAHGDVWHLLGNFMYGAPYMIYAEFKLGWKKAAIAFFFSGIIASLLHLSVFHDGGLVGSSGAIMGMVGVALSNFRKKRWQRVASMSFFLMLLFKEAISLINMMFLGVSNTAHIGGLLIGFSLRHLLSPSQKKKQAPVPLPPKECLQQQSSGPQDR